MTEPQLPPHFPLNLSPDEPLPAERVPLVDRVAALEEHIIQLTAQHNRLVDDVTRELGL